VSILRKSVPKPIMSPLSPLETLVPRPRWHFLRAELRWAYTGRTHQRHGHHWLYTPHTSAWLVLRGRARVRTAGGVCSANAGQWLIAPPGERWQETSLDCQILSICFVWQWIFGRELLPITSGMKLESTSAPGLRTIGLRLARTVERLFPKSQTSLPERSGSVDAHLELQQNFDAWLVHFYRAMLRHGVRPTLMSLDPRVEEAVQILDRPGGNALRPAELARQLGASQSHLNRLFLRDLGTTVRGYVERQKLASARMLLGGSRLSVKETAFRLGFTSPQHFSRWFRQRAGIAPTQVRQADAAMI
jgi:AraC-like DNA-binding protein